MLNEVTIDLSNCFPENKVYTYLQILPLAKSEVSPYPNAIVSHCCLLGLLEVPYYRVMICKNRYAGRKTIKGGL